MAIASRPKEGRRGGAVSKARWFPFNGGGIQPLPVQQGNGSLLGRPQTSWLGNERRPTPPKVRKLSGTMATKAQIDNAFRMARIM